MFVLDTNIISELRSSTRSSSLKVHRWAASVDVTQFYLSAITVMELETGVLGMERKDKQQGIVLRAWLDYVLREFRSKILPFTKTTAVLCASLHVPDRRPYRDAMIAATAKEHGLVLVTRNIRDFQGCGVEVMDPWQAQA